MSVSLFPPRTDGGLLAWSNNFVEKITASPETFGEEIAKAKEEKKKARQKFRNDPKLVAAARELRDRYTEQINAAPGMLPPSACGKYDVSRALEGAPTNFRGVMKDGNDPGARLLDAA